MIALAPALKLAMNRYGGKAVVIFLLLNAAVLSFMQDRTVTQNQQAIEAGVQEIFAQPVHYLDEAGVIGSFPRTHNHFTSGWALAGYRERGEAFYTAAIRNTPTPMLIRNTYALSNIDSEIEDTASLLPADAQTLRDNFIPHWGEVYVAGRHIDEGPSPITIEIFAPGTYTLEGASIAIDGSAYKAGDVVELVKGQHTIQPHAQAQATLRYGDHLPRPSRPWPEGEFFTAY